MSDDDNANTERPSQGPFTVAQKTYLKTFLPAYIAKVEEIARIGSGPKGIAGTKGDKKSWIESTVYPAYCTQFDVMRADGPQLGSLKTVSVGQFYNITPLTFPPPENRSLVQ